MKTLLRLSCFFAGILIIGGACAVAVKGDTTSVIFAKSEANLGCASFTVYAGPNTVWLFDLAAVSPFDVYVSKTARPTKRPQDWHQFKDVMSDANGVMEFPKQDVPHNVKVVVVKAGLDPRIAMECEGVINQIGNVTGKEGGE